MALIACEVAVLIAAVLSRSLLDYPNVMAAFSIAFLGFAVLTVASIVLLIAYSVFSKTEIENRKVGLLALTAALLCLPTIMASTAFSY